MAGNSFEKYYLNQAGTGLPTYVASKHNGGGLGNILGGLSRMFLPVIKKTGSSLLKEGLRTGVDILSDVASGNDIKTSAERRLKQSSSRVLKRTADKLARPAPPGQPSVKRTARKYGKTQGQSRKRKRTAKDIFG